MNVGNLVLALALLPYLFCAARDHGYHLRLRKVTPAEHLLHLGIAVALLILCSGVFARDLDRVLVGACLFFIPAGVDELIFHREIPTQEHDVHAKEHFLLLVFVLVGAVVSAGERGMLPWLQRPPGRGAATSSLYLMDNE